MKIDSINNTMSKTNFGEFKPYSSQYLRQNYKPEQIKRLNVVAENIRTTKFFDLEAIVDGFRIVDKLKKIVYSGDLAIKTFGMWGEGGTWLINKEDGRRLHSLESLEKSDWMAIQKKYQLISSYNNPEKYVYYTELLEKNTERSIEKNNIKDPNAKQADNEEEKALDAALKDLLNNYCEHK